MLCLYSAESGELIDTALVSRGEVALAVMEGVAFRLRVLLETMDVQNQVDTVVLFGEPTQEVPASILQLRDNPTRVIMSESLSATIREDDYFQY